MGNIISSKKKKHQLKFTKARRKSSRSGDMTGNVNAGGNSTQHANANTDDVPTMNDDEHLVEEEMIINAQVQIAPPPPPPTEYTEVDDSYVCGVPVAKPIVSSTTNAGVNNTPAKNNDSGVAPPLNYSIDQNSRFPDIPPEIAAEKLARANIAMAVRIDEDETEFGDVGKRMGRMGLLG